MKREYLYAAILASAGIGLIVFLYADFVPFDPATADLQNDNVVVTENKNVNDAVVNGNANTNAPAVVVNGNTNVIITNTNTAGTVNTNTPTRTTVKLTLVEIATHRTTDDCWLVINGQVYDVTTYLRTHPGGVGVVAPYCGDADATQAFTTQAGQGSHSSTANNDLKKYLLGPVNGTITVGRNTAPENSGITISKNTPPEDAEEEDDD